MFAALRWSAPCGILGLVSAAPVGVQAADDPPPVHQPRAAEPAARSASEPARFDAFDPADLPPATPPPYRFAGGLGLHVDFANDALAGYGNGAGIGLHFSALAAPPTWPVLFGVQLGLETYGGPERAGTKYVLTSYYVLAAVRLQPDHWTVRPRLDLLGGLWGLDLGTPGRESSAIIDASSTVGGRATFGYGAALGIDFVLGRGETADYGLGVGAQLLGGADMTLPDPYGPGQRETTGIGQLMFLVELVGLSKAGH